MASPDDDDVRHSLSDRHCFATLLFLCMCTRSTDAVAAAGQLYTFRLMRNPGLVAASAPCLESCITTCAASPTCTAVSYLQPNGTCLQSYCNNIDLFGVKVGYWVTYVVKSTNVELIDFPQPVFEWMLTDTCGSSNQGVVAGPSMQYYQAVYGASPSVGAGQAIKFTGTSSSRGVTSTDSAINKSYGSTNSMTVMVWAIWETVAATPFTTLVEFSLNTNTRGMLFWLCNGGLWYDLRSGSSYQGSSYANSYPFVPVANTWYHVTFSVDGQSGIIKSYLNYSLVAVNAGGAVNKIVWDNVQIASSIFDNRANINGRLFCVKIFNTSLIASQIALLGQSCLTAKMRLTSA